MRSISPLALKKANLLKLIKAFAWYGSFRIMFRKYFTYNLPYAGFKPITFRL